MTAPRPARLVVLVSGAGTNLQALLDACRRPGVRRRAWSPSAPTGTASRGSARADRAGVPTFVRRVADYATRERLGPAR